MEVVEFSKLYDPSNQSYLEIAWMTVEQDNTKDTFGVPYLNATKVHDQVIIGNGKPRDFTKMRLTDYNEPLLPSRFGICVFHLDKMEKYTAQSHAAISLVFSIV